MEALLPHRGTARLLTGVTKVAVDRIVATGRIPAAHPLAVANRAPCFLGIELGAQAAAALEALQRSGGGQPRVGYLVGVRAAAFLQADLPVETLITITADLEGAAPPLAIYRIAIEIAGTTCLTATLSTYSGADGTNQ